MTDATAGDAGRTTTMPDGPDSTRHAANDEPETEEARKAREAEERRLASLSDPVALRWREQELDAYDADEPTTLRGRMVWAQQIAAAGLLPKEYRDAPANVLLALEYGKVHGLSAMQSVLMLHVIEGKPGLNAEGMRALVLRAGHTIVEEANDGRSCTMYGKRADNGVEQRVTWTLELAVQAGLCTLDEDTGRPVALSQYGKPLPWQQYPAAMLRARASTELCRLLFADVLGGLSYSTEELQDQARDEATTVTVQEVQRTPAPAQGKPSRPRGRQPKPPEPEPEPPAEPSTAGDNAVDNPTAGPSPETVQASVERVRAGLVAGADQVAEVAAAGDADVVTLPLPEEAVERVVDAEHDEQVPDQPEEVTGQEWQPGDSDVALGDGSTAAGEAEDDDDPRPWGCPTCGEEYPTEELRDQHVADDHAGVADDGPPAVLDQPAAGDDEGRAQVWAELEQLATERGKTGVQQLMMRWTIANKKNAADASEAELREFLAANK